MKLSLVSLVDKKWKINNRKISNNQFCIEKSEILNLASMNKKKNALYKVCETTFYAEVFQDYLVNLKDFLETNKKTRY